MAVQINKTDKTPFVHLCGEEGRFIMEGVILPEDAMEFFNPIMTYVTAYLKDPHTNSEILCKLEYFNTAASRMLYAMFKLFNDADNTSVNIKWHFEDDDEDLGEVADEFEEIFTNVTFEKVQYTYENAPNLESSVPVV